MNMHAACCAFRGVRAPSVFTVSVERGGHERSGTKKKDGDRWARKRDAQRGCRETRGCFVQGKRRRRLNVEERRNVNERGWTTSGGGLLICIRKTKGVGRTVCLPLISRNEGRRGPIKSLFPPSSLYAFESRVYARDFN